MNLTRVVEPTEYPVTLDEVKAHLRVDHSDDESYIEALIAAATQFVEDRSWRAFRTQTWEMRVNRWPCERALYLPRPPLQSIDSFRYIGKDETVTDVNADSYRVEVGFPGSIMLLDGKSWPTDELLVADGIRIRFVCGYAQLTEVPRLAKQVILLMIGHWYENREAVSVGAGLVNVESTLAVQSIINLIRWR